MGIFIAAIYQAYYLLTTLQLTPGLYITVLKSQLSTSACEVFKQNSATNCYTIGNLWLPNNLFPLNFVYFLLQVNVFMFKTDSSEKIFDF